MLAPELHLPAPLQHVSKCGFTSCRTGNKNKRPKNPQSNTLERINLKIFITKVFGSLKDVQGKNCFG
jgi:hypothetical protein